MFTTGALLIAPVSSLCESMPLTLSSQSADGSVPLTSTDIQFVPAYLMKLFTVI